MRKLILEEDNYKEMMEGTVEPYLEQRYTQLWLEREEGKKIFCAAYRADHPAGTVVLSHGFTETAEKYKENIYYFLRGGYHVYMPEHCGHGRSYRLTEDICLVHVDKYQRYVEDLVFAAEYAKREHPQLPLYLFGHSMGGGIAAAAMAFSPDLFEKAILSSPMIRPDTGPLPWRMAKRLCRGACLLGMTEKYVPGHHPYRGADNFENSSSISRPRYEYYQEKRKNEPLFQTSGASYGWSRESVRLNNYLQHKAFRKITAPVLLFQAERDELVSAKEQERFMRKLSYRCRGKVTMVKVPGAKHEIFNANGKILEGYWKKIFSFLSEEKR